MSQVQDMIVPSSNDKISCTIGFAVVMLGWIGVMIYSFLEVRYEGGVASLVILLELIVLFFLIYLAYYNLERVYTTCIKVDESEITFSIGGWKRNYSINDIKEILYITNSSDCIWEDSNGRIRNRSVDSTYWFVITKDGYAEKLGDLWFSYNSDDDPYIQKLKKMLSSINGEIKLCHYENYDLGELKIRDTTDEN